MAVAIPILVAAAVVTLARLEPARPAEQGSNARGIDGDDSNELEYNLASETRTLHTCIISSR